MKIYLHLTEVIDFCPKKFWFRIHGYEQSVRHIYSLRGTLVHRVIQNFLSGKISDINEDTISDVASKHGLDVVLTRKTHNEFVMNALDNFKRWFHERLEPDIDRVDIDVEKELRIDYDEVILTGTPDLVIWGDDFGVIIDFKTGSRINDKHELQLVGYEYMLNSDGILVKPIKTMYDVYLGGRKYREVPIKYYDVRRREFQVILEDVLSQIPEIASSDKPPEGILSNKCIFCDYRGVCDGV